MEPVERMNKLLIALRMNADELAISIGRKKGDVVRNVLKERNGISKNLAFAICSVHENINPEWLLFGKGEMFLPIKQKKPVETKTESQNPLLEEKERTIKILLDRIEEQKERVEDQRRTISLHEKCIEELTSEGRLKKFQDLG